MAKIKPKISRKAKAAKNYTGGQDVQIRLPDGSIETVNTASPLYAQMYGANQIQSTPGTEAEPINLQEVTVRPPKGFWEQSYDKFQQDNKDSEFIGAMLSPFTYALSVPQQAMMYGATGKVQDPSEALGIENPYLAFAANSIIDPANIVGAGLASKGRVLPFLNNLVNPFAGTKVEKYIADKIPFNFSNTSNGLNLEELRRAYHNSKRFLQPDEISFLRKHGYGKKSQYRNDNWTNNFTTDQVDEWWRIRDANRNQLPPPPSEIEFMPDGTTRTVYNRFVPPNQNIIPTPEGGLFGMTREQTEAAWRNLQQNPDWNNSNIFTSSKPKTVNKSGLTKEEALQKASGKDKDAISKMSEIEFENTVLKPTGEVVPYESQADLMPHFTGSNNVFAMSPKEYADAFNERLDLLNDIIAQKNKSGVEYRVKGLDENGRLTFYTPEQNIPKKLTPKQQENIDLFNKNPEEWLKNKAGLKKEGDKWTLEDNAGSFNSLEEAIQHVRKELDEYLKPQTIKGESTWSVKLNPGQWRGNVEDIANTQYFRSIPGLEMSNTTGGVFADHTPRKGTAAYESINEYLKQLDLGRVKPGFNSQTQHSRSAWENFIKSGRGVGFYGSPTTVYGTMKSVLPYIGTGYLGYQGLQGVQQPQQQEYKQGGSISNWEIVDDNLPIARNGVNVEEVRNALSETQKKINTGQAAKKKYQEDLVNYAKSVENDPDFNKKVSAFVKQRCGKEGAACISAASKLLEGAGYPIGKGYHQNPTLQKDIVSGNLPGFSYDHNSENLEIGDIIQLTGPYTLTKGSKKGKQIEKAPYHAMTVTGLPSKDSTGLPKLVQWFGSTGSIPSIGFHDYDMSGKSPLEYEILKRNFVDPSLVSTRDSLKEILRREDPFFEKPSNWKPRYLDFKNNQKLQYSPEGGIDNNPLKAMTKSRIESMYAPLFKKKKELMKEYNLTNSEFNNLAKILGGIGEQETENAGLTSLRYGIKRDPALGPIAQFFGKVLTGDISNAFDPGQYSTGPWQTKADYVPKTNYKRGSVEEAFATLADRYKNQVPSKYRGTDYGYGLAANKYKGLKQDRNEYLKNVLNYANMFDIFEKDYSSSNDNPEINYDKFKESEKKAKTENRERIALPGQSSLTNFFQSGGNIPIDPMGYRNPDNYNKPAVTIPSNEITMKEKNGKPLKKGKLLGIDDTGYAQMMYPGEDYIFPGDYVTEYPLPEAGGGYRVIRSNERKGKTHKVIGPDGTVKFFGDSKLGQHPKDPARKKAFYARHKKNLAKNPYFRAFARKTWADGGELDFAQEGIKTGKFEPKKGVQYTASENDPNYIKYKNYEALKERDERIKNAYNNFWKDFQNYGDVENFLKKGQGIEMWGKGLDKWDPNTPYPSIEDFKNMQGIDPIVGTILSLTTGGRNPSRTVLNYNFPNEELKNQYYSIIKPFDKELQSIDAEASKKLGFDLNSIHNGVVMENVGTDGVTRLVPSEKFKDVLPEGDWETYCPACQSGSHFRNIEKSVKAPKEVGLLPLAPGSYYTRERQPSERFSALYDSEGNKYSAVDYFLKNAAPHEKRKMFTLDPVTGKIAFKNPETGEEEFKFGGMLPDLAAMAAGGQFLTVGGEYHRIYKNADGDIMVNHPKEDKGKWDTINLTDKAGAKTVADGVAATKKWHRENPYAFGGNLILEKYQEGGDVWEIVDDENEWEII